MSKGAVHSVRVAIMKEDENTSGLFHCDSHSMCVVVPLEHIGLRLDSESMEMKRGIDGVKVVLPEDGLVLKFSQPYLKKQ